MHPKRTTLFCIVTLVGLYTVRLICEWTWGRCRSKKSMVGRTVIITGASSGVGKATALELARRGAKVILACHSINGGLAAAAAVRQVTSIDKVALRYLDLASLSSIRAFVKRITEHEPRVDVLINNAAIYNCPYMQTDDGFEMQMGVNHLGHFLLTNLLLGSLKACRPSRIVVVTSSVYVNGRIQLPDLVMTEENYGPKQAYADSKLASVFMVRQLARRLEGTGVTVYAASPGLVYSRLGRYSKLSWYAFLLLLPLTLFLVRTPTQGCQTVVDCAVNEKYDHQSGNYYRNCKVQEWDPIALNDDLGYKVWCASEQLTSLLVSPSALEA